ncbi:hypothetical protein RRG08_005815 [Elysia crispata]|uniref:Uncharacterized protein n=1 Tax=Elysia crispata TaxID=231223 RepID=A0AAE1A4N0_9GAST|nr:hypothetical protein RRG08_005815 [Elysia crispata]
MQRNLKCYVTSVASWNKLIRFEGFETALRAPRAVGGYWWANNQWETAATGISPACGSLSSKQRQQFENKSGICKLSYSSGCFSLTARALSPRPVAGGSGRYLAIDQSCGHVFCW